ncbi:MAG TPA: glycoside hydrolase family 130 protein [Capsulimonadaceae bacterium]
MPGLEIACLLNPGAFCFDGKTWLLLRVAERPAQVEGRISFPVLSRGGMEIMDFDKSDPSLDLSDPRVIGYGGRSYLTTLSHLRLVSSDDGVRFSEPIAPVMIMGDGAYESFGVEDCRVSLIEGTHYLTYTQVSELGVGVGLASTQDWRSIIRHGMILPPHNKDCALFEHKIGGKYYALHRPSSVEIGGNYIWIAESPDLLHWGNHRCVATSRAGMWDSGRIGAGASPIRTDAGWLEIYHGASEAHRYCLGALLLDINEPWKVIARSKEPIMQPVEPYETSGFFGEVIFTNGHVVDGDKVTVYYGASDYVVCSAEFSILQILDSLGA